MITLADVLGSHWTPLLFGLAYLAVTAVRSVWLRRTAGISGYVIDHADPTHRFVAAVFAVVVVGLLAYFATAALWPPFEDKAGRLDWAAGDVARWATVALMAFATVWTAYAQFSMGNSWRIGIPQGAAPPLRLHGPFALSRNPIFLGMLLFVLGMTLWSPSVPTIAFLVAAYMALEVQVRGEEAYLEAQHGEVYRAYRTRVRRWI
jgi:protein-S-isoprenylcysteine O-methyltransferase Ste14